ncbi:MAG: hypothetical protein ACFCUW_12320 [Kiloniellaceae bacterium]
MIEEVSPIDLLPLIFTTALVVFALAMGSADLARTAIRVAALACAALCLAVWGAALLSLAFWDAAWGEAAVAEFYATAFLARLLGLPGAGVLLSVLALAMLALALRELWRRRVTLLKQSEAGKHVRRG